ncbi:hypothetical protein ABTL34_19490, partial [Acinetobacter baumannii]
MAGFSHTWALDAAEANKFLDFCDPGTKNDRTSPGLQQGTASTMSTLKSVAVAGAGSIGCFV